LAVHRYSGIVNSHVEESGIQNFELKDTETQLKSHLSESYVEWKTKVGPALEALTAAVPAVIPETPKEGEKKEGEEEVKPEEPAAAE